MKVREALKAVVDRQAMIDTVLLGFGEPGADNPVPVPSPASYVKEAPKQDYELAMKLLAEAGHADGLKFDLYTAEGVPGMVRMAQVYAQMAKPAGFNINVIVTPAESFWDEVWLHKSITTSAWSMRPPGEGLAVAYTENSKWPETHWKHPEYDALLLKANTTVDSAARLNPVMRALLRGTSIGVAYRDLAVMEEVYAESGLDRVALDWCCVRPVTLTNGRLTRSVREVDHFGATMAISRADVAWWMLERVATGGEPRRPQIARA